MILYVSVSNFLIKRTFSPNFPLQQQAVLVYFHQGTLDFRDYEEHLNAADPLPD